METKEKLIKDRECISCKRIFNCTGKTRGTNCIHFIERKNTKDNKR